MSKSPCTVKFTPKGNTLTFHDLREEDLLILVDALKGHCSQNSRASDYLKWIRQATQGITGKFSEQAQTLFDQAGSGTLHNIADYGGRRIRPECQTLIVQFDSLPHLREWLQVMRSHYTSEQFSPCINEAALTVGY